MILLYKHLLMYHTDIHLSRGWLLRYFRILIYLQRGAVQLLKEAMQGGSFFHPTKKSTTLPHVVICKTTLKGQ